jgi:selenocysteine-specific elongation factor
MHGQRVTEATAGSRAALNLGGVDVSDLARGHTLCDPGAFEPTRRFDVVLDLIPQTRPLKHGARVRVHCGTSEVLGRVAIASRRAGVEPVGELPAGDSAYARIRLESPMVVTRGDRFILRAYSPPATIGGGVVIDPMPPRGAIRTASGIARFRQLIPNARVSTRR